MNDMKPKLKFSFLLSLLLVGSAANAAHGPIERVPEIILVRTTLRACLSESPKPNEFVRQPENDTSPYKGIIYDQHNQAVGETSFWGENGYTMQSIGVCEYYYWRCKTCNQ